MKFIIPVIILNLALLSGLFFFTRWWTALLYFGGIIAIGMYTARFYDRHHRAEKFFGGIDNERQRLALEAYVSERRRAREDSRAARNPPFSLLVSLGQVGHLECLGCGRLVEKLVPITGRDLKMNNDEHFQHVCPSCLEWVRASYRLESRYTLSSALGESALTISLVTLALIVLAWTLTVVHTGGGGYVSLAGFSIFFTGVTFVWDRLRVRYGFLHNFHWAMRSRHVFVGFSLISGSIIGMTLFQYIPI